MSFFKLEDLRYDELAPDGDDLQRFYRGELNGLVIRGVFDPAELEPIAERLDDNTPGFEKTLFPEEFKAGFFGLAVDMSEGDLKRYAESAARFRQNCRTLFEGASDFERRTFEMLGKLSGGRPVEVPEFDDGGTYTPATIRWLPPGGYIRTHCGNECMTRPGYSHLNRLIDNTDQLSYFLTIRPADTGGELVVYSLTFDEVEPSQFSYGHTDVEPSIENYDSVTIKPDAGDVILFDGGRYLHRVSPVGGARTRWTIGGFVGFSQGGERNYVWN